MSTEKNNTLQNHEYSIVELSESSSIKKIERLDKKKYIVTLSDDYCEKETSTYSLKYDTFKESDTKTLPLTNYLKSILKNIDGNIICNDIFLYGYRNIMIDINNSIHYFVFRTSLLNKINKMYDLKVKYILTNGEKYIVFNIVLNFFCIEKNKLINFIHIHFLVNKNGKERIKKRDYKNDIPLYKTENKEEICNFLFNNSLNNINENNSSLNINILTINKTNNEEVDLHIKYLSDYYRLTLESMFGLPVNITTRIINNFEEYRNGLNEKKGLNYSNEAKKAIKVNNLNIAQKLIQTCSKTYYVNLNKDKRSEENNSKNNENKFNNSNYSNTNNSNKIIIIDNENEDINLQADVLLSLKNSNNSNLKRKQSKNYEENESINNELNVNLESKLQSKKLKIIE
jgi:hypothetical protein